MDFKNRLKRKFLKSPREPNPPAGKPPTEAEPERSTTGPSIILSNPRITGPPQYISDAPLGIQEVQHSLDLQTAFKYRPLQKEEYDMDGAPPYAAMSYAWGKPIMTRAMFCRNAGEDFASFSISEHVLEALNSLFGYALPGSKIWIDALCINQKDPVEKAIQISLMPRIFSQAQQVLCWLGQHADKSDMVIENLPRMVAYCQEQKQLASLPQNKGHMSTKAPDPGLWFAAAKFFCRPWFHRLWIVQEVLLSRELVLVCGDRTLSWGGLHAAATELVDVGVSFDNPELIRYYNSGVRGIFELGGWHERGEGKMMTGFNTQEFVRLLLWSCQREVTEQVDRVWALSGLAQPEFQQRVAALIDYSDHARSNFHDTYKAFVRVFLQQDKRLSLLSLASLLSKHQNLPSWCPNLCYSLAMRQDGLLQQRFMKQYNAGYAHTLPTTPNIRFLSMENHLAVRGFFIDKVNKIRTPAGGHKFVESSQRIQYDYACVGLASSIYRDPTKTIEAHSRTIIADRRDNVRHIHDKSEGDISIRDLVEVYITWLKFLTGDLQESTSTNPQMKGARTDFSRFSDIALHRSYIATEGGRIGLGPLEVELGDVICIFFGADTPYIVRPNGDGQTFTLIGDAYVHGVMYGEALGTTEKGPDCDIVIA